MQIFVCLSSLRSSSGQIKPVLGGATQSAATLCECCVARCLATFLNLWRCRTIGFEEGLIIRSTLGRMIMAPALIATRAELDELVDKTRIAVDRTAREYGRL